MADENLLAREFDAHRQRLQGVAYRMLGSLSEAEDAVQEAWIRLGRTDASEVGNLGGWLTTVVARICLDMLRRRTSRREDPLDAQPAANDVRDETPDPETERMMADQVGLALLVVLQTLDPAERIAFVLHDMFDLPFEQIGPIVGRNATAARQLASRARRRVRGPAEPAAANLAAHRRVVEAFLAASRAGDLDGLLAVLSPDVVFSSDARATELEGTSRREGSDAVAKAFLGRAQMARAALVDGALGVVVAPGGKLLLVLDVRIVDGRIVGLHAIADPDHLRRLTLAAFD